MFKRSQLPRLLWSVLLVAVLASAFLAYLQPGFIVDLANRLILCF
jgi:hypothetical protein